MIKKFFQDLEKNEVRFLLISGQEILDTDCGGVKGNGKKRHFTSESPKAGF